MRHKLTIILLFVALFCGQVLLGRAQSANPTPQAQQAFIQRWAQEVIFPSAVRFTLAIALPPEQVKAVTLTLKPETRAPITIPLDLSSAIITGGDVTGIAYVWQLPADNPPLLFKDINFDWQVTAQSGQSASVEDKFIFEDQRVNWLRDLPVTDTLKLTFPNGKASSSTVTPAYTHTGIGDISTTLKQVADLLATNLGSIPTFDILIYDTTQLPICSKNAKGESVAVGAISSAEVACVPSSADQIFSASGYTTLNLKSSSLGDIQSAVTDYIVQQSYAPSWSGKNIPEWFQAGLTEFYSADLKSNLYAPALIASRSNSLLSLDVMAKAPATGTNVDLWRSESYGLVVYIASQIGVDGLFKLASNAGTASSFEAAYQTALGKPIATLLGSFGRWIFTNSALGAFTFTVYQAATPSPTPTLTATITQTPTPTDTATFTPTPTVTGVISLTPLPSRTPTFTPTPAPATNTPRPAGSLNTLTPTPTQPSAAANVTNADRSLGIFILVAGAIIVVVAAFILFRPRR
ncbi:MAG: hypothetical protein ABI970_04890 [Chloroflexota bacterium]